MKLTEKQIRFAQEFIIDLNATQAAIRAGYKRISAGQIGHELLKKHEIQVLIQELKEEREKRTEITADMVVREFAKIGFINVKYFYDDTGKLKPLKELTDEQAAAIAEVKTREFSIDGESKIIETTFKLNSKVAALQELGKHTGIYEKDNKQKAAGSVMFYIPENGRD